MPVTFSDFEREFLVAAYQETDIQGENDIFAGDLLDRYPLRFRPGWLNRLLDDFSRRGLIRENGIIGQDRDQPVELTASGMREAERLLEEGVAIFRLDLGDGIGIAPSEDLPSDVADLTGKRVLAGPRGSLENLKGVDGDIFLEFDRDAELLPASDRLVPLDHNSGSYKVVKEGLSELFAELRSSNDLECTPGERERLLTSLSAAQKLWEATQLKVIQIKVGIIITVEDVVALLSKVGKAVGGALVIDTIKSIVKQKAGMDL